MEKITLNPLDDTAVNLLQTAAILLSETTHNKKHSAILRRMAMDLDKTPPTVGELDSVSGFLLQTALLQFAAQTTIHSHANILRGIAKEINEKIHQDNNDYDHV